jgi:hypothetical protein
MPDQTERAGKWSPFTVADLDGLTWNEAFRKFVIGDAEVVALGERAIAADSGLLAVYRSRWLSPDRREWPVRHESALIACEKRVGSPIGFGLPDPPTEVQQAARALRVRFVLLIEYLRTGAIVAETVPKQGGGLTKLPASLWSRWRTFVDPDGDVLELDEDLREAIPIFIGLILRKPAPFTIADLDGLSLKEAYRRLVMEDPEVVALRNRGGAMDSKLTYGEMLGGRTYTGNYDETVLPLDDEYEDDPDLADASEDEAEFYPPPPSSEHLAMYRAARRRLAALIGMLRDGKVEARGHPVHPGHGIPIPHTIWSHPDFMFRPETGDVFEVNREWHGEDGVDWLIKRWVGVVLHRPQAIGLSSALEPSKETDASDPQISCQNMLIRLMRDHLRAPKLKNDYWQEARQHWPDLTRKEFDLAWLAASKQTGAKWSQPGAPTKEERKRRAQQGEDRGSNKKP